MEQVPPSSLSNELLNSFLGNGRIEPNNVEQEQKEHQEVQGGEDEAALIDSFFLPGGLLADDDENNNNNSSGENLEVTSPIPLNPWERRNNHQSPINNASRVPTKTDEFDVAPSLIDGSMQFAIRNDNPIAPAAAFSSLPNALTDQPDGQPEGNRRKNGTIANGGMLFSHPGIQANQDGWRRQPHAKQLNLLQSKGVTYSSAAQNHNKDCAGHHHQRDSSSAMGENLVMGMSPIGPFRANSMNMTPGTNRLNNDSTVRNWRTHEGVEPNGSGRLLLDQASPIRDREIAGSRQGGATKILAKTLFSNSKPANDIPPERAMKAVPSSSHRADVLDSSRRNENKDDGWRDRRPHHHHSRQQKINVAGPMQSQMRVGNDNHMVNNKTNIYETLDVFEQEDDYFDGGDNDDDDGDDDDEDDDDDDDDDVGSNDADELEEADEEEDEEDEDDAENLDEGYDVGTSSIPLDICKNLLDQSTTSSLSTFSDVDSPDESSRASDFLDETSLRDEGVGYDTDQAHVSMIFGMTDESGAAQLDGGSRSSPPYGVCSAEEPPDISSANNLNGECDQGSSTSHESSASTTTWLRKLRSFSLSILEYPSQLSYDVYASVEATIRQSHLYTVLLRATENTKAMFHILSLWMVEARDVTAALISQLLAAISMLLATLTKALILAASFLFLCWKYSLLEAVEESSVTICYNVFYLLPLLCSTSAYRNNVPHWAPHLMIWLGVFLLCHQVESGPLNREEELSIFRISGTFTSSFPSATDTPTTPMVHRADQSIKPTDNNTSRQRPHLRSCEYSDNREPGRVRDRRACRTILKILRLFLPVFFLADGFSSEFGTIIGVSGASRLTTAFMMCLVRKNLVSSPIGWVSWAIQVLLATYNPSWALLDVVILVVGLSSIRLIRYVDEQRARLK